MDSIDTETITAERVFLSNNAKGEANSVEIINKGIFGGKDTHTIERATGL